MVISFEEKPTAYTEKKMFSKKLIGGKQVKITSIPYVNALILNSETSKGSLKNIYCKSTSSISISAEGMSFPHQVFSLPNCFADRKLRSTGETGMACIVGLASSLPRFVTCDLESSNLRVRETWVLVVCQSVTLATSMV